MYIGREQRERDQESVLYCGLNGCSYEVGAKSKLAVHAVKPSAMKSNKALK